MSTWDGHAYSTEDWLGELESDAAMVLRCLIDGPFSNYDFELGTRKRTCQVYGRIDPAHSAQTARVGQCP